MQTDLEVTTTDVNGEPLLGQLAYVRSLEIEGLKLKNVPLTFADAPAFEALGLQDQPVLSLGMQHLKIQRSCKKIPIEKSFCLLFAIYNK